jgi:hypothetical protein
MGTRALTFVYDSYKAKNGRIVHRPIINLYRQYDGYPEGHGAEIYEFIKEFTIVNGLTNSTNKIANGMGCFAGQLVAHFKDGAGQFYLEPVTAKECGQDYEYHIYQEDYKFKIKVVDRGCNMFGLTMSDKCEALYDGDVASFKQFCKVKDNA